MTSIAFILMASVVVSAVVVFSTAHAKPMHAGIDYKRYLQERDSISSELDEWLNKYEAAGLENGWLPVSATRTADEVAEDRKQRFFMTKQLVSKLEKEQPDAQFTTDTPFTLLTEEEFASYVRNSYLAAGSPSLRSGDDAEEAVRSSDDEDSGIARDADSAASTLTSTSGFLTNLNFSSLTSSLSGLLSKGTRRLQASSDWTNSACNSAVQQQGQCGSCWAFATVGAVETAQCLSRGGRAPKYSEQQLTSCDRTNVGCRGGTIGGALRYIQQTGLCTSAAYPYASAAGRSPACSNACAKTQVSMRAIMHVTGEAGLVTALNTQPVVIAVHAANNVWKQYRSGVVTACPNGRVDHAVIAIGYDATTIKIKNSWGARWGESGYVRLRRGAASTGTCGMLTDMSFPQI